MSQRLCTCALLFLLVASQQCAQSDAQQAPDAPRATASSVLRDRPEGLIKLDVLVTGSDGKPVAGLTREGFSLSEQGRNQKILSFDSFDGQASTSEPPAKIILLIDAIALPPDLARDERNAVVSYLRRDGGHLVRPISVFIFSDSGLWTVAQDSDDGNVLAREIERNDLSLVRHNVGWQADSRSPGPKDAPLLSALKALGQIATTERTRPGRKLLLWVGPGSGLGSGARAFAPQGAPPIFNTVWWFSDLLREAHLVLYSFTVGESNPSLLYKDYLPGVVSQHKASFMNLDRKVLAVQSGGRVMDDSLDLEKEIESCVQESGPFYRISFDPFPADHAHEYHALKVVVDRLGLIARTNTGYYDQPYYSVDPIPEPTRISVAQLEQLLVASHGESDADLAKQLAGLTLTERLSEHRLSLLDAAAGKRVRQELRILADSSAFLDPPPDDIISDAPPDPSAQQHMLSLASAYLRTTVRKLPDLFARQTTVRYQETPIYQEGDTIIAYQHLHVTDSWATTVRYRNGFEIVETEPPKRKPNQGELITYGVFGPALAGVLDMIDNDTGLTWSRWEQGDRGRMAVFHYVVPFAKSVREVWLCCLPDGDGKQAYKRYAGYEGEIALDPESGAILRVGAHADLQSTTPLARSDIAIEYGPVDIGGKAYICPLRSISILRARSVSVLTEFSEQRVRPPQGGSESFMAYGPYATMLNDITYDRYHIFRSESRVLTGFTPSDR